MLFGLLVFLGACSVFKSAEEPAPDIHEFANDITVDDLYADLAVLADDSLQGRNTGSEGLKKAARYLSKRYTDLGLQAVGDDNSYYQYYDLTQNTVQSYSYKVVSASGDSVISESSLSSSSADTDFLTMFGGSDAVKGEVVFAGYGMYDEASGVNQYPDDVSGKWLMVFFDRAVTDMNKLQSLINPEGAVGALLIIGADGPDNFSQQAAVMQGRLGNAGGMSLKYLQNDNDAPSAAYNRISNDLAADLVGVDSVAALADLATSIKAQPSTFKAMDLNVVLSHNPEVQENIIRTKNVVAFLEGSDPELKDEVVVLSSHYDHVGVGQPDSTGDAIYNGADDDGSGTVATLHTAQAMAAAKKAGAGPKRSVLFLHVSGEEKGLLGSRYYSDHPIYPIDNTIANINIDMIGRVDKEHVNDSSYVYIIGGSIISSGLDSLTQAANAMGDNMTLSMRYNDLEDPNQFYRRSDHWNFGRLGVPFVFFFNGVHEDYHRPGDEIGKITFGPFLQRTKLVYNLTALLANSDERPVVDNQEFIEKTKVEAR